MKPHLKKNDATGSFYVTFAVTQLTDQTFRINIKTNDQFIRTKMEAFDILHNRLPTFKVQSEFYKQGFTADDIKKRLTALGYKPLSIDYQGYTDHTYQTYRRGTDKYAVIDSEFLKNTERTKIVDMHLRTNDPLLGGLKEEMKARKNFGK
ncbi:MAG: hypothetical protein Q7S22_04315 [Candidatus Micrarchaeota archaeon]|nr:hypothetical protein [Candidatus Micrarchaeota archaeon]